MVVRFLRYVVFVYFIFLERGEDAIDAYSDFIYVDTKVLIHIASRPPAATQGFRHRGLLTCKIKASKPPKHRAKTNTHAKKNNPRQQERFKKGGRQSQKMNGKCSKGGGAEGPK